MDQKKLQNTIKALRQKITPFEEKCRGVIADAKEKWLTESSLIGIDIGTSSVKVVQADPIDGRLTVVKTAFVPVGGAPGNDDEVLASLKTALVGFDTQSARVTAVVNCPQTCTRRIITPNMPPKELSEAIKWEAKNAIPFSIEGALMGYEVLGDVLDKGLKKMRVAVAATPKETADRMLSLLTKAGCEPDTAIPVSVSLQNLLAHSADYKDRNIAIVEIGANITELNIYQSGVLAFSRKLPIAGQDITKSLTSTLMSSQGKVELSLQEAEQIKIAEGIPVSDGDDLIDGKIMASQVLSLVRPCVEQLVEEIERSFDFFREETHGQKVDKIVLFGGGALLKGLTKALFDELGIEVVIGDALANVPVQIKQGQKEAPDPVRFDLAVGAVFNRSGKINLLPEEVKEKTWRFVHQLSLKAVAVGVLVSVLLFYVGLHVRLGVQNKKLATLKLERRTLLPQLEGMRSAITADEVLRSHPYWEDVLKEISHVIEARMYLTNLGMEDDVVTFKGVIVQDAQDAQSILSRFMLRLEEGLFKNVSLVTSKKESEDAVMTEFEITAEIE